MPEESGFEINLASDKFPEILPGGADVMVSPPKQDGQQQAPRCCPSCFSHGVGITNPTESKVTFAIADWVNSL